MKTLVLSANTLYIYGMRKGQILPRIERMCKCGNVFYVRETSSRQGRGLYCSQKCKYKYRIRPKGLVYTLVKENPTSFKKGLQPWNKGLTGLPSPVNFTGDNVGYCGLHDWISYHQGKACKCEHCGTTSGRIEWANKSHEYKRDISDWIQLCKKCHVKYDRASGNWGIATRKFNIIGRRK